MVVALNLCSSKVVGSNMRIEKKLATVQINMDRKLKAWRTCWRFPSSSGADASTQLGLGVSARACASSRQAMTGIYKLLKDLRSQFELCASSKRCSHGVLQHCNPAHARFFPSTMYSPLNQKDISTKSPPVHEPCGMELSCLFAVVEWGAGARVWLRLDG
jgi:hypothetical protein